MIAGKRDLCDDCVAVYGSLRADWPEWLRAWVNDAKREYRADEAISKHEYRADEVISKHEVSESDIDLDDDASGDMSEIFN